MMIGRSTSARRRRRRPAAPRTAPGSERRRRGRPPPRPARRRAGCRLGRVGGRRRPVARRLGAASWRTVNDSCPRSRWPSSADGHPPDHVVAGASARPSRSSPCRWCRLAGPDVAPVGSVEPERALGRVEALANKRVIVVRRVVTVEPVGRVGGDELGVGEGAAGDERRARRARPRGRDPASPEGRRLLAGSIRGVILTRAESTRRSQSMPFARLAEGPWPIRSPPPPPLRTPLAPRSCRSTANISPASATSALGRSGAGAGRRSSGSSSPQCCWRPSWSPMCPRSRACSSCSPVRDRRSSRALGRRQSRRRVRRGTDVDPPRRGGRAGRGSTRRPRSAPTCAPVRRMTIDAVPHRRPDHARGRRRAAGRAARLTPTRGSDDAKRPVTRTPAASRSKATGSRRDRPPRGSRATLPGGIRRACRSGCRRRRCRSRAGRRPIGSGCG